MDDLSVAASIAGLLQISGSIVAIISGMVDTPQPHKQRTLRSHYAQFDIQPVAGTGDKLQRG
jgi:hypothetical protein